MPEMNLPAHWKTAILGEVTDIFKGGTPKRSVEKYFQGNIAWAIPTNITALDSALYIDDTDTHISEEALGKSAARLLPSGTVLLTSRATIGETAITTVPMATNQGFANFICKDMLLNVYLAYYLRYIKKRLVDLAHGSTFKEITKGTLLNVEIPLPPLPEQRAIAHVLQTIQEAKSTRQRELALERERKAALMDYLFSHGTKGESRKQTEIGEIPESWEVIQLEQVLENTQYGLSAKANLKKQGYPLLRMNNLVDGLVNTSDLKHIQLDKEELEKFRLNKGDVLFNRTNSFDLVGKTGLFDKEGDYVFASYLIRLATDARRLNSYFLSFYFNWKAIQIELKRLSFRGAGQSNISASKLKMFKIRLPSLLEQQQIADVLCAFDTKIATLEQEAERLDELFHAMLDELMTGKRSAVPLIDAEMSNWKTLSNQE